MKDVAIATSAYVLTRWVERSGPLMLPSRGGGNFDAIRLGAVCGLAKWCHNAEALVREPALQGVAEIFLLTNNLSFVRRECGPSVRAALFSDEVRDVVAAYGAAEEQRQRKAAENKGKSGLSAGNMRGESQLLPPHGAVITLLKWQLIGETRYKAMLIAELDVDLFHHGRVTSRVPIPPVDKPTPRSSAEALRDASLRIVHATPNLVAHSDVATPINAGMIFLKPSRSAYEYGLALLRTLNFSPKSGWNSSGGPREVLTARALSSGFVVAPACSVSQCSWWAENTWNFIGANADQGLLATVFLGLGGSGVRAVRSGTLLGQRRKHVRWNCLLGGSHFGGRDKPWLLHFTRCLRWFDFLDNLTRATAESSACVPWLRAQRRRALKRPMLAWDACGGKVNDCIL